MSWQEEMNRSDTVHEQSQEPRRIRALGRGVLNVMTAAAKAGRNKVAAGFSSAKERVVECAHEVRARYNQVATSMIPESDDGRVSHTSTLGRDGFEALKARGRTGIGRAPGPSDARESLGRRVEAADTAKVAVVAPFNHSRAISTQGDSGSKLVVAPENVVDDTQQDSSEPTVPASPLNTTATPDGNEEQGLFSKARDGVLAASISVTDIFNDAVRRHDVWRQRIGNREFSARERAAAALKWGGAIVVLAGAAMTAREGFEAMSGDGGAATAALSGDIGGDGVGSTPDVTGTPVAEGVGDAVSPNVVTLSSGDFASAADEIAAKIDTISSSHPALTVQQGEGGYSMLQELGVPKELRPQVWEALGTQLEKQGVTYRMNDGLWGIAKPGSISPDVLKVALKDAAEAAK